MANNKNFENIDDLIKSAVEGYEIPFQASDWDQMSNALDSFEAQQIAQEDLELKSSLEQFEIPLMDSDWDQMSEALDRYESHRKRTFILKAMEVSIVLLLFISAFQLIDFKGLKRYNASPVIQLKNTIQNIEKEPTALLETNNENVLEIAGEIEVQEGNSSTSSSKQKPAFSQKGIRGLESAIPAVNSNNLSFVPSESSVSTLPKKAMNGLVSGLEGNELPEMDVMSVLPAEEALAYSDQKRFSIFEKVESKKSFVEKRFERLSEKRNRTYPSKKLHFAISLLGTYNYNQIDSDNFTGLGNSKQSVFNQGAGFRTALGIGDLWEIGVGANFASLSYSLDDHNEELIAGSRNSGYLYREVEQANFNFIEIPFYVRRKYLATNKISVYGSVGGTYYLSLISDYQVESQSYAALAPTNAKIENFQSTDEIGIAEGGDWSANSYLSVDANIGIEYLTRRSWSVFVEPGFKIPFSKIGPNDDYIQKVSLSLGLRYRLF